MRRWVTMIEPPANSRTSPAPTVQRRSKPVNGSVLADAFAGFPLLLFGALLEVAGATVPFGVVDDVVGSFVDFDGDVPLPGDGLVLVLGVPVLGVAGVVGVVGVVGELGLFSGPYPFVAVPSTASAGAADARPSARTTGRINNLRRARDVRLPTVAASDACGLLEAMALVRVMPTSDSWSDERCGPCVGASCGDLKPILLTNAVLRSSFAVSGQLPPVNLLLERTPSATRSITHGGHRGHRHPERGPLSLLA